VRIFPYSPGFVPDTKNNQAHYKGGEAGQKRAPNSAQLALLVAFASIFVWDVDVSARHAVIMLGFSLKSKHYYHEKVLFFRAGWGFAGGSLFDG
jgi:hypothetical protein